MKPRAGAQRALPDSLREAKSRHEPAVILSAAKDLVPFASGDEVLRCAQDDEMGVSGVSRTCRWWRQLLHRLQSRLAWLRQGLPAHPQPSSFSPPDTAPPTVCTVPPPSGCPRCSRRHVPPYRCPSSASCSPAP